MLISRPLPTKLISSFIVGSTGDAICQFLSRWYNLGPTQATGWDHLRSFRQGTVQSVFMSTSLHYWLLYPMQMISYPSKSKTIAARYLAHQVFFMPYVQSVFFFGMGIVKHRSISEGVAMVRENFVDSMKLAVCYWPFVSLGLYTVVPVRFGNIYMDSFALVWAIVLSYIANRK